VTDFSDHKKLGIVLKNRQVFDEHYIFVLDQAVHIEDAIGLTILTSDYTSCNQC